MASDDKNDDTTADTTEDMMPPWAKPGRPFALMPARLTDDSPDPRPAKPKLPPADKDEVGGPKGAEPTRFGDWEKKGRCVDF